jgi:zinc ribbon protein
VERIPSTFGVWRISLNPNEGAVFFLIGGVQPRTVRARQPVLVCPECGKTGLRRQRVDMVLSLFFIPLFPVRKGTPRMVCDVCGTVFDLSGKREHSAPGGRKCPSCGRPVQSDFSFCPSCGRSL